MLIHPEVIVTPDHPTVIFREPQEKINLSEELPKILVAQGWGVGTYFHVQFISHDRSHLLASGEFVVSQDVESLHTSNPDSYQPVTKTLSKKKAVQIGEWFTTGLQALEGQPVTVVAGKSHIKWNPGKKVHEVLVADQVVFSSPDKAEAENYKAA